MKAILTLSILVFSILNTQSQTTNTWSEIKESVTNPESKFYYPDLIERYNNFDSTLTTEDYAHIYLGYVFEDNYIRFRPDESKMQQLKEDEKYEELVKECKTILEANPVSLKANDNMGFALYKLGKEKSEWSKYQNRYRAFRKVIAYSGDGKSSETAFKVLYVSDEYNVIYSYFEIEEVKEQSLVGTCDYFKVSPSTYFQSDEMYFDISRKLIRQQEIMNKK